MLRRTFVKLASFSPLALLFPPRRDFPSSEENSAQPLRTQEPEEKDPGLAL